MKICKLGYIITYYSLEINASVTESRYTIKSYYYAKPNEQEVIKVMCNIIVLQSLVFV